MIDDLGLNRRGTAALNRLRAPLTLAFLPYATDLERADPGGARRGPRAAGARADGAAQPGLAGTERADQLSSARPS